MKSLKKDKKIPIKPAENVIDKQDFSTTLSSSSSSKKPEKKISSEFANLTNIVFFKKTKVSKKVDAGGPSPEEQLLAMVKKEYWTVLNAHLLGTFNKDSALCDRVNAFKHALQTYGPTSDKLPDFRHNTGKAKHSVYHGHVHDSNGITYVLEWAVVDLEKQIMAFIDFGTHENYLFQQAPLTQKRIDSILCATKNIKIIDYVKQKTIEAEEKVERVCRQARGQSNQKPLAL